MQENPKSQEKKVTKGSFFEVPGVVKAEYERGMKSERKTDVTSGSGESLKREEPTKSEFKPQEKLETGYTEKSWEKPEGMEEKVAGSLTIEERKIPDESDFKAPGEIETGYTEKSWTKPEEVEERVIIEPEERKEKEVFKAPGEIETGYTEKSWTKPKEMEKAAESPTFEERKIPDESDFKASGEIETGYTEKSWTKPKEMEERVIIEPGERKEEEAREKVKEEAREEKRTTYTMKKRLTKSKKDRMLFGVCGGLGEYFGIDPTFIRLAFAALALQGIGIFLYILLAILMPSGERYEMVPSTKGGDTQR
jgi:phage shock protein C